MKRWKVVLFVLLLIGAVGVLVSRSIWSGLVGPGTRFAEESRLLYIHTGDDLDRVVEELLALDAISDARGFKSLADWKKYSDRIKPGRYRIPRGISANELLNKLRNGEQEPVRVTFTNIDHLPELAGRLALVLEPDSLEFLSAFSDPTLQQQVGLDASNMISLFIPNTYEFWWTTTPERFIERMRTEHRSFWNGDRQARATEMRMSPAQVAVLASIVQAETVKADDAKRIAGVYLNRLRIGMPLQADPTLKFAMGLDSVRRILDRDKLVDSPYNTYRRTGLPPGPINMPEPRFLDAVLYAEKHDYLYFCARADLSGYSDFSRTYEQHLVNARNYHRALNKRGIHR
ncbi:MAG: endolytic transglycosylase MltG [Flavobacteriales bacterium]|nr:endolytic transglycosylase MltG [Flavobacteriales bacterium]